MNTKEDMNALASAIANAIKMALMGPLVRGRIEQLEARLVALEQRPGLKYCGIFQTGKAYSEAQLVTHQGGLWLAESPTTYAPGADGSGWKLIVKRGEA